MDGGRRLHPARRADESTIQGAITSCRILAPLGKGTVRAGRRFFLKAAMTAKEVLMNSFSKIAAAATIMLAAGSVSAYADCNRDTGTETALGAGSGALVGGLASHSVVGAVVGGVAGGVIGNSIGQSNNREDCRRDAYEYDRQREAQYEADRYGDR